MLGFDPKNPTSTIANLHLTGVCVASCPNQGDWICMYSAEDAMTAYVGSNGRVTEPQRTAYINACMAQTKPTGYCTSVVGNCYKSITKTTPSFYRCTPSVNIVQTSLTTCVVPGPLPASMMSKCAVTEETLTTVQQQPNNVNFLFTKLTTVSSTWTNNLAG